MVESSCVYARLEQLLLQSDDNDEEKEEEEMWTGWLRRRRRAWTGWEQQTFAWASGSSGFLSGCHFCSDAASQPTTV
eukprot:3496575-Rhodomonas_salina.1